MLQANKNESGHSRRLNDLWRRKLKLGSKHLVPKAAGDTKAIFEISEVVLQVILL